MTTEIQVMPAVRINCGVDLQAHRGFGAYSAVVKVGDRLLDPIAGLVEENATFIRCCLMAAVVGLEALDKNGQAVEVITPSTWVAETLGDTHNFDELRTNGWMQSDGNQVIHTDLFKRLAVCIDRQSSIDWRLADEVGRNTRQKADDDTASDEPKPTPDCRIRYGVTTLQHSDIGAYHVELVLPERIETVTAKFQTNNYARANLTACIDALDEARKLLRRDGLRIVLETPDRLTADAINRGWLETWSQNKWTRREGDPVYNSDLWRAFLRQMQRNEGEVVSIIDSPLADQLMSKAIHAAQGNTTGSEGREDEDVKEGRLIRIFTNGVADPSPGRGGWAAVMEVKDKKGTKSAGYKHTTNNRMGLMGVADSLDFLVNLLTAKRIDPNTKVIVTTDSEYLVSAMTRGWAKRWRKNQWIKQDGEKAENIDLFKRILRASDRLKKVEFRWMRSQLNAQQPSIEEREMCSRLAKDAAAQPEETLSEDTGFTA